MALLEWDGANGVHGATGFRVFYGIIHSPENKELREYVVVAIIDDTPIVLGSVNSMDEAITIAQQYENRDVMKLRP